MEGLQNDDLQSLLLSLKEGAIADELQICSAVTVSQATSRYPITRSRRVRIPSPLQEQRGFM